MSSRQQTAGSQQQTAGSRQPAAGSQQQAAGSRQQAADSKSQVTNNCLLPAACCLLLAACCLLFWLYSLLLTLAAILLSPLLLLRWGKYAPGLRQRLGFVPELAAHGQRVLWLHCVSVGETQAARPLVDALLKAYPDYLLVVSTITVTGQRLAQEVFSQQAAAVFYFPADWAFIVRRVLRRIKPSAVLIMETELWPNFLRVCREKGVPTVLVNGRLSARSARGYQRVRWFIAPVINNLTLALMQTDADAARLRDLGLVAEKIKVAGNIKFDLAIAPAEIALTEELRQRFVGLDNAAPNLAKDAAPLLVAASTHAPEERILLTAFELVRRDVPTARLLIAPRHPPRFNEVAALIATSGYTWAQRSAPRQVSDSIADIILLDSIGELRAAYPLATVVFMGGSLAPTGGHNMLEPALSGACIVTGPHTFNFTAIVAALQQTQALVQLPVAESETLAAQQLADIWRDLLRDATRRQVLGDNARRALAENRGATARTVELLKDVLSN